MAYMPPGTLLREGGDRPGVAHVGAEAPGRARDRHDDRAAVGERVGDISAEATAGARDHGYRALDAARRGPDPR